MKKHWYIISGLLFSAIIIGVIILESQGNYYKVSIDKIYTATLNNKVVLSNEALTNHKKSILFVYLSEGIEEDDAISNEIIRVNILPSDLLNTENRKRFNNHSGIIVLQSEDTAISVKAWVLLSRVGFSNVKILNDSAEESLKYTFQPNTITEMNQQPWASPRGMR